MADLGFGGGRDWNDFRSILRDRMQSLLIEQLGHFPSGDPPRHFVITCALLLVIDEDNGGDLTAKELVRRFHILDHESRNVLDFYFLGWEWVEPLTRSDGIRFSMASFKSSREALRLAGVQEFGGNADLILLDAHVRYEQIGERYLPHRDLKITLDFRTALRIDLSSRREAKEISPLGEFLQSLIAAAGEVRDAALASPEGGSVALISDKLGLAVAKKSLLDLLYSTWGGIIGAKRLDPLATRNLGPPIDIYEARLSAVSASEAAGGTTPS